MLLKKIDESMGATVKKHIASSLLATYNGFLRKYSFDLNGSAQWQVGFQRPSHSFLK